MSRTPVFEPSRLANGLSAACRPQSASLTRPCEGVPRGEIGVVADSSLTKYGLSGGMAVANVGHELGGAATSSMALRVLPVSCHEHSNSLCPMARGLRPDSRVARVLRRSQVQRSWGSPSGFGGRAPPADVHRGAQDHQSLLIWSTRKLLASRKIPPDALEQLLSMHAMHARACLPRCARFASEIAQDRTGPVDVHGCQGWCAGWRDRAIQYQKRVYSASLDSCTDLISSSSRSWASF